MNILFVSLGCDKNLVDTEVMLGMLASRGYQMVEDESEADIIVINTCCFIHDARKRVSRRFGDVRIEKRRQTEGTHCDRLSCSALPAGDY